jgi:hypothetical protein
MFGCLFQDTNMDGQHTAIDCIYKHKTQNCSDIDKCMQEAANILSDSHSIRLNPPAPPAQSLEPSIGMPSPPLPTQPIEEP